MSHELDQDGDGEVTQEELIAALDKDGDGVIDNDEFMYAIQQGIGQGEGGKNYAEFPEIHALCRSLRAPGGDLRQVRSLPDEFGTKGTGAGTMESFAACHAAHDIDVWKRTRTIRLKEGARLKEAHEAKKQEALEGLGGHRARSFHVVNMRKLASKTRNDRVAHNVHEMEWSDEILRLGREQAAMDRMAEMRMKERMAKRAADQAGKACTKEREQKARLDARDNEARLKKMDQDEKEEKRRKEHDANESMEAGQGKVKAQLAAARKKAMDAKAL